jgi:hypothetical protein
MQSVEHVLSKYVQYDTKGHCGTASASTGVIVFAAASTGSVLVCTALCCSSLACAIRCQL